MESFFIYQRYEYTFEYILFKVENLIQDWYYNFAIYKNLILS